MTDSEVERLSRMLTDMRIQSAREFATIEAQLKNISSLESRVVSLEQAPRLDPDIGHRLGQLELKQGIQGKFMWSDVWKILAAGAGLITTAYTVTHWS
jgi:hypothetical protein